MSILVDTCVWSNAMRRSPMSPLSPLTVELTKLVRAGNAVLLGMVRQEILSGINQKTHYEWVRNILREFDDFQVEAADHELAAEYFTQCRQEGIQGSHVDFLQCAIAVHHGIPLFTTDKDFTHFAKVIPITLHSISA